jgi:mRNA-degrading endonuclease toxin of MazEF toxin-antitoxin module
VVIVQADGYNQTFRHALVAESTTNLAVASDPANLLIEVATPDGMATGLAQDSVITCLHLATMSEDRLGKVLGTLSPLMLQRLTNCLKAAMAIP